MDRAGRISREKKSMNPYEAQQTGSDRKPATRRRKWPVVVAVFLAGFLAIGGMAMLIMFRVERALAMQVKANRAEQAAQAEALRAREAASKAESVTEPSTP